MASLRSSGVVAVIRTENPEDLASVSRALCEGGVKFVEITMTVCLGPAILYNPGEWPQ
jgi:2-keto-3-deoxy-6-phosphogluconate aldolase